MKEMHTYMKTLYVITITVSEIQYPKGNGTASCLAECPTKSFEHPRSSRKCMPSPHTAFHPSLHIYIYTCKMYTHIGNAYLYIHMCSPGCLGYSDIWPAGRPYTSRGLAGRQAATTSTTTTSVHSIFIHLTPTGMEKSSHYLSAFVFVYTHCWGTINHYINAFAFAPKWR